MTQQNTDLSNTHLDTHQIGDLRSKIDAIDEQIQHLINERASIAQKVAIAKKEPRKPPHLLSSRT